MTFKTSLDFKMLLSTTSSSFRRRRSSVYGASFRRFVSNLKTQRDRVVVVRKRSTTSRTGVEELFNEGFDADDSVDRSRQPNDIYNNGDTPDSGKVVLDHHHDYATILYKPNQSGDSRDEDSIEIYSTLVQRVEDKPAPVKIESGVPTLKSSLTSTPKTGASVNVVTVEVHREDVEPVTDDDVTYQVFGTI